MLLAIDSGGGSAGLSLYRNTSWGDGYGGTQVANWSGTVSYEPFRVERVGNVYTVKQSGTTRLTWIDSGDTHPRDSSHRLVGSGAYYWSTYNYVSYADNWQAEEL